MVWPICWSTPWVGSTACHGQPLPYMMWLMQRPTTPTATVDHADAWFHIEIASPSGPPGVPRFIAAAEVACAEYFNPVIPEELAEQLRSA